MTTAPYAPEVAQLITSTHAQTFRAVAVVGVDEHPLDVTDYTVSIDENRSPRWTADLTCALPAEDVLEALDPRTLVRVRLLAGYRLPSGTVDEQEVAELHLRERRVSRPENTLELTCASAEALLIDAAPSVPYYEGQLLHDSCVQFITQTIDQLLIGTPLADPDIIVTTEPGPEFVAEGFPTDYWNVIIDAADALDAAVYDAGDGTFRVAPRQYLTAESVLSLTVGQGGTITASEARLNRNEWWNGVTILWTWSNRAAPESPDRVWGQSFVVGGPFAPEAAGYRNFTQQRDGRVNTQTANRVANTLMRRLLARARTYTVEAVAAWWLRPEHTVTVQLPAGAQERHLVATVEFRTGGRMRVTTRLPDDQSVIGE